MLSRNVGIGGLRSFELVPSKISGRPFSMKTAVFRPKMAFCRGVNDLLQGADESLHGVKDLLQPVEEPLHRADGSLQGVRDRLGRDRE